MAAIEAIVLAAAAGFAFVVAITVIVIIGVRQEERHLTFPDRRAPSGVAGLARLIVGRHVDVSRPGYPDCPDYPDDFAAPYEELAGASRR